MLRNSFLVGLWAASQKADRSIVVPSKPSFSMAKTKAKLAEFFKVNEETRLLCEENKTAYPRMHQSVQATALQLVSYYIKNWGQPNAKDYEIRITHGYLKRAFNNSCCIATIKNHINKLLKMYKGFIKEKYRGGLRLERLNTPCIVLVLDPKVLRFEDERHNKAVEEGELSAEHSRHKEATQAQNDRNAAQSILTARTEVKNEAEKRNQAPSSFAQIFQTAFSPSPKLE